MILRFLKIFGHFSFLCFQLLAQQYILAGQVLGKTRMSLTVCALSYGQHRSLQISASDWALLVDSKPNSTKLYGPCPLCLSLSHTTCRSSQSGDGGIIVAVQFFKTFIHPFSHTAVCLKKKMLFQMPCHICHVSCVTLWRSQVCIL